MNTCKTCKHWITRDDYETGHGLGVGRCAAVPMFWDSTKWDFDREGRAFNDGVTATAFAQDGSDYAAELLTKPEHGCTMHEAK